MNHQLAQLQAVLFTAGAPVSKKHLVKVIGCKPEELEKLAAELREEYAESGVVLVDDGSHIALVTNPALEEFIGQMHQKDRETPLSRPAQETLSIIAYAGPISKIDLDFLRGVNTQYTVRRLSIRGLIREEKKGHSRLLTVTVDFLAHLGIQRIEELPEYETTRQSIWESIKSAKEKMGE